MSVSQQLKKGSTGLLILALLEAQPRHGYELGKLIEFRSGGRLKFRIASLYPVLCQLEDEGLIAGRWLEKEGERRRRYYRLTPKGRKALKERKEGWEEFIKAVSTIVGIQHG